MTALLTHYGQWVHLPRRQATGPAPKPRWMPLPGLLYAQVIKTVAARRLVDVKHRVVFGTLVAVRAGTGAVRLAHQYRLCRARQPDHPPACGRCWTAGQHALQGRGGLRQQLALHHVYYNFCLPHASLRQPLSQPEPTKGIGSAKTWQPWTPAMAAGLTDHVWTLREVLLFRVPPWPQPA